MRSPLPSGCMSVIIFFGLILLFPLFLTNTILGALAKLGLSPSMSLYAMGAMFLGGMVNIPVRRIPRNDYIDIAPFGLFGVGRLIPRFVRRRTYTTIAVNLGGCIVPCSIAAYELIRIAERGSGALAVALASTGPCSGCLRVDACEGNCTPYRLFIRCSRDAYRCGSLAPQ
jgi:uncharacterized membrane protein